MWSSIVAYFLGILGPFVANFAKHFQKQIGDNPEYVARIKNIIIGIDESHPDWKWSKKLEYASDAALEAARELSLDVARALVNTLIETVHLEIDPPRPGIPMPPTATQRRKRT